MLKMRPPIYLREDKDKERKSASHPRCILVHAQISQHFCVESFVQCYALMANAGFSRLQLLDPLGALDALSAGVQMLMHNVLVESWNKIKVRCPWRERSALFYVRTKSLNALNI